ncbi:nonsense-mediated mRNA decay factor SMG8 [Petromyzon marinus]|uniref:nonsense-mediated mRNA decay factor SMG8 n=1 Tax=Petromyzon marinus TaxID=7757 RepID=UPI003F72B8A8
MHPPSLESLLAAAGADDAGDEVCVIGVCGLASPSRSNYGHTIVNILTDRLVFPVWHDSAAAAAGVAAPVEAHYDRENRTVYLVVSSASPAGLLRASVTAGDRHAETHAAWRRAEKQHCLAMLFVLSVSHIVLLQHPTCTFDITYDRLFRALDQLRQKLQPQLRALLQDCPVGKEWQLNCRPCPPRLLFIFQLNGALRASDAGLWREGDSPATAAAGAATKLKRHSPKRRLQHALEDQIYHVFRKSRLLTNQSVNCLFTVPANQAFVYVMAEPPDDPVGSLIRCLRSNCSLKEGDGQNAGPRRYQLMRRSARPSALPPAPPPPLESQSSGSLPADPTLREFVWQHAELVFARRGFDDSVGRNPQPAHFELPTLANWAAVAGRLSGALLGTSSGAWGEVAEVSDGKDDDDEEDDEEEDDGGGDDGVDGKTPADPVSVHAKVQSQLKCLEGFLDADTRFSESRCQKALPLAHSAYQAGLPHHYTSAYHRSQLAHALSIYRQHARGPAYQAYLLKLQEDCHAFWQAGHQLCEERSLTDQHCIHKYHLLPKAGELADPDQVPPVVPHCSRSRATSTCNCGSHQGTREDPFTLRAANFTFYETMEDKYCGKLEHFAFPTFGRDTGVSRKNSLDANAAPAPVSTEDALYKDAPEATGGTECSPDLPHGLGQAAGTPGGLLAELQAGTAAVAGPAQSQPGLGHVHSRPPAAVSQPAHAHSQPAPATHGDQNDAHPCRARSQSGPTAHNEGGELEPGERPAPNLEEKSPLQDDQDQQQQQQQQPLGGMVHLGGVVAGRLPSFSSWSLVRLGPAKAYVPSQGLTDMPGFVPGTHFLMPWDVPLSSTRRSNEGEEEEAWPAIRTEGAERAERAEGESWRGFAPTRTWRRGDNTARAYVGYEYEDSRGRRFMCSAPDKVMKVAPGSGYRDFASRALAADMPLYVAASGQSRGPKPALAQLMRLYVVVPDASVRLLLAPQVQPGSAPCPIFVPEQREVTLPTDGLWVLRLPMAYGSERGPCLPPRDTQGLSAYRLLRGVLRAET